MSRSLAPALTTAGDIIEYDLECKAVDDRGRPSFLERFIHCEIYKARADVKSVIHTHSPGVIPFAASTVPLRPMYHVAGFLAAGVPVFEIRKHAGMTNMLISGAPLGKALAETLGDKPVVLMRGHGNVVVGPSVQVAVYRAIYTEINARLQAQAIALGGPITYLEQGGGREGRRHPAAGGDAPLGAVEGEGDGEVGAGTECFSQGRDQRAEPPDAVHAVGSSRSFGPASRGSG